MGTLPRMVQWWIQGGGGGRSPPPLFFGKYFKSPPNRLKLKKKSWGQAPKTPFFQILDPPLGRRQYTTENEC